MLPTRQTYMRVRKFQKSAKELSPVDSTQGHLGWMVKRILDADRDRARH
jgi:hypothetical protein